MLSGITISKCEAVILSSPIILTEGVHGHNHKKRSLYFFLIFPRLPGRSTNHWRDSEQRPMYLFDQLPATFFFVVLVLK